MHKAVFRRLEFEPFAAQLLTKDVVLRVELMIDDDAIIDRLAARAYKNKSGSSSFMNSAVVIRAKLA